MPLEHAFLQYTSALVSLRLLLSFQPQDRVGPVKKKVEGGGEDILDASCICAKLNTLTPKTSPLRHNNSLLKEYAHLWLTPASFSSRVVKYKSKHTLVPSRDPVLSPLHILTLPRQLPCVLVLYFRLKSTS